MGVSQRNWQCRCVHRHLLLCANISNHNNLTIGQNEFIYIIKVQFPLKFDQIKKHLPEHGGEDVGENGDNDEQHEGKDDKGWKTTANVLPTSRRYTYPPNFHFQYCFTLTFLSCAPPLDLREVISACSHPRNQKTCLNQSPSPGRFLKIF